MKYIFRIVIGMALVLASFSCSRMDVGEGHGTGSHTYRMRFECNIDGVSSAATKSGYVWEDGTVLHLQFVSKRTKGLATYNAATDEWIVETEKALSVVDGASCEVYWFNGLEGDSVEPLTIGPNVSSFKDINATYSLFEGGLMVILAKLTPMTSRLRFTGDPDRSFVIEGLRYCSEYSFSNNIFTRVSETVPVNIGPDGSSDYYYVIFADSKTRTLTIEGDHNSAFVRSFSEDVLAVGASGHVTAPTPANPGKWMFVNKENMQEIVLPTVSEVFVSNVRGTAAHLEAKVLANGNGILLSSGFVYGKNSLPTLETAMSYSPEDPKEAFSVRLGGLDMLTTYYVRAYASNPKGLVYGPEVTFVTTDEDNGINSDGFDEDDEDWNTGSNSTGVDSIGKEDWGDDENWNNSSGGDVVDEEEISKDDWPSDENWNEDESN